MIKLMPVSAFKTSHESVTIKIDQQIAIVTLNRADKLNALDRKLITDLVHAAKVIRKDKSIRAVILKGDGKAFCTGLDFPSFTKEPVKLFFAGMKFGRQTNLMQEVAWCWRKLPIPVIAVLHGHCYGGGLQIALACDFRFATSDCKLSIMEAKWGLIPDMTGTVTLREILPIDLAKELTMTARVFSGREAESYGLVTHVSEDPMKDALRLIDEICAKSPDSVCATKAMFHRTRLLNPRWAFALETWYQIKLFLGKNQSIALKANFKNEKPRFNDRR